MSEWISVKDRLPGENDYRSCYDCTDGAVFWYNGQTVGLGWYYHSTKEWAGADDCGVPGIVTHWMPLPSTEGLDET